MLNLKTSLILTDTQHSKLRRHLFPGDGFEAAAIVLCRDAGLQSLKLLALEVILVPHQECARARDRLTWPGTYISDAVDSAEDKGLTILLVHSHPGHYRDFSLMDDRSDLEVIGSIFQGWSGNSPRAGHGSAIMMPDGEIISRLYQPSLEKSKVDQVSIVGDDLRFFWAGSSDALIPMAFGGGMTAQLGKLHACVIGVSGTGSIIAEQAARMGFGKLTLIDFDRMEPKNLNRILNSTAEDAATGRLKVAAFSEAVRSFRNDVEVEAIPSSIASRRAVMAAGAADIIFCCVDSAEGRHIADRISQAFMVPLIDMGVTIPTRRDANGLPAVAEVSGRIDYVVPGGPTLGDRGVYTSASLRAEYLKRVAPESFAAELEAGYIKGAIEEAPSVIALNMRAASAAMLEFVARAYPFRHASNRDQSRTVFALADGDEDKYPSSAFEKLAVIEVGTGAQEPLLGLPGIED